MPVEARVPQQCPRHSLHDQRAAARIDGQATQATMTLLLVTKVLRRLPPPRQLHLLERLLLLMLLSEMVETSTMAHCRSRHRFHTTTHVCSSQLL